jgi:hypothetical protein
VWARQFSLERLRAALRQLLEQRWGVPLDPLAAPGRIQTA